MKQSTMRNAWWTIMMLTVKFANACDELLRMVTKITPAEMQAILVQAKRLDSMPANPFSNWEARHERRQLEYYAMMAMIGVITFELFVAFCGCTLIVEAVYFRNFGGLILSLIGTVLLMSFAIYWVSATCDLGFLPMWIVGFLLGGVMTGIWQVMTHPAEFTASMEAAKVFTIGMLEVPVNLSAVLLLVEVGLMCLTGYVGLHAMKEIGKHRALLKYSA